MVVYLDDLLIYNNSHGENLENLELVLSRLLENQLFVGKLKCELMTTQTEFVGLHLGVNGISIGEDRKKIIREWPTPKNMTKLREFIGLLQFFRRFIKRFSHLAAPLTKLTRKGSGIHKWNEQCTMAFNDFKSTICREPVM